MLLYPLPQHNSICAVLTPFLPAGPSCVSQTAIHSVPLNIVFFYSWVCFWKSVHSLLSLVICLVTNVWILFLSGSSLWNKRLPRCICFLSVFVWWHASFVSFFFNFLIFLSFCRFKNHKFVWRKNNILLNFIINLCGSNLMLSSFFFQDINI